MAIPLIYMARTTIKSTYALDPETVRRLDALARRWGVSKSEVLRRTIRAAAESAGTAGDAAAALERLQGLLGLDPAAGREWARRVRAERRAASGRRERRS